MIQISEGAKLRAVAGHDPLKQHARVWGLQEVVLVASLTPPSFPADLILFLCSALH